MTRKQLIGLAGAGGALLALTGWFFVSRALFTGLSPGAHDVASRLAFVASWLPAPGLALLAGVWAAARRGFSPDAIDGTRNPSSHSLEINLRYNQNTVEQVLLAVLSWTALALALPAAQLYLIPAMAVTFIFGRATFWIGYLLHPMGRTFGMVVTIGPTICAYAWLISRLFGHRA